MDHYTNIENISACFQNLPPDEIVFLSKYKTQVSFLKGETIFKQGAFTSHVLFLNGGIALTYMQTGNKRINIRLARQGDYLAFSTIFNRNTYQYSAISLSDSSVCMIDKEALKEVIMRNPDFAWKIISKNNLNESRYLNIIDNLWYKQMRGKLASTILYLTSEEFKDDKVFQLITRQDIADFASITVESAVRFLKEFENDGFISLEGKEIIVRNIEGLKDMIRVS